MLKLKLKRDPNETETNANPSSPPAVESKPRVSNSGPVAPKNRLKLSMNADKKASSVRLRLRTNKVLNDGFDIEAPDREEDPTMEEAIVLRMLPHTPAHTRLRQAVETNDFQRISIKFEDRRHAVVSVHDEEYAAQLMDLPTITEVHKTIDRRNIFKTLDVSQILLVTHRLGDPKPSLNHLLQFSSDPLAYPHGLTPPMFNVRNRRFQKRMPTRTVEQIESQVEELLKRDAEAKEVTTELLPASAVAAQQALAEAARAAARARTEESDIDIDDDLDMELERAMMNDGNGDLEDADSMDDLKDRLGTPPLDNLAKRDESNSDGEEDVDDDNDDDLDDDLDDERPPNGQNDEDEDVRQHNKQLREEIRELETTILDKEKLATSVVNQIMRARHMDAVTRLRSELEKKKGLLRDADQTETNQRASLAATAAAQNEDEEEDEEDEEDMEDEDEGPEMPLNQELPAVPASTEQLANRLEISAADMQLRDQLSGLAPNDDDLDDLF